MSTYAEIKAKYLGDDATSKAINRFGHSLKREIKKSGKMTDPQMAGVARTLTGLNTANAYASQNRFKYACIIYADNQWQVQANRMGNLTPVEAQAYANDLLKAVAAVKKAPAIKK